MELQQLDGLYWAHAEDKNSPLYGMSRKQFAAEYEKATGDSETFKAFKLNKLEYLAAQAGQAIDLFGRETGINDALGNTFAKVSKFFGAGEDSQEAARQGGKETFSGLYAMAWNAVPFVGRVVGAGLAYGDALEDNLAQGRSLGEARGGAAVGAFLNLTTSGASNIAKLALGNKLKHDVALVGSRLGQGHIRKLLSGTVVLPKASLKRKLGYEAVGTVAATGYGVVGDIADTVMFDPNTSLTDMLTSGEYWYPMLIGEAFTSGGGDLASRSARSTIMKIGGRSPQKYVNPETLTRNPDESEAAFRLRRARVLDVNRMIEDPTFKLTDASSEFIKEWELFKRSEAKREDRLFDRAEKIRRARAGQPNVLEPGLDPIVGMPNKGPFPFPEPQPKKEPKIRDPFGLLKPADPDKVADPFFQRRRGSQVIKHGLGEHPDDTRKRVSDEAAAALTDDPTDVMPDALSVVDLAFKVDELRRVSNLDEFRARVGAERQRLIDLGIHETLAESRAIERIKNTEVEEHYKRTGTDASMSAGEKNARRFAQRITANRQNPELAEYAGATTKGHHVVRIFERVKNKKGEYDTTFTIFDNDGAILNSISADSPSSPLGDKVRAEFHDKLPVKDVSTPGVYRTPSIPDNIFKFAQDLLRGFGLDVPILLRTTSSDDDIAALEAGFTIDRLSEALPSFVLGAYNSMSDNSLPVTIRLKEANNAETLIHEIGHAVFNKLARERGISQEDLFMEIFGDSAGKVLAKKTKKQSSAYKQEILGRSNIKLEPLLLQSKQDPAHEQRLKYLTKVPEILAVEFERWFHKKKDGAPASLKDKFFSTLKEVWDKITSLVTFKNPEAAMKSFLDSQFEFFHTNLLRATADEDFDHYVAAYDLSINEAELLGTHLYRNAENPDFRVRLEQDLEIWNTGSKGASLASVLKQTNKAIRKRAPRIKASITPDEAFTYLDSLLDFAGGDKHKSIQAARNAIANPIKQLLASSTNTHKTTLEIEAAIRAWRLGELRTQSHPFSGGLYTLSEAIAGLKAPLDPPVKVSLDNDNKLSESNPRVFATEGEAIEIKQRLETSWEYPDQRFSIEPEGDGFRIVTHKDPTFKTPSVISHLETATFHDRDPDSFAAVQSAYGANAAPTLTIQSAVDSGNTSGVIKTLLGNRDLPDNVKGLVEQGQNEIDMQGVQVLLDGIGQDLGMAKGPNLEQVVLRLVQEATDGRAAYASLVASSLPVKARKAVFAALDTAKSVAESVSEVSKKRAAENGEEVKAGTPEAKVLDNSREILKNLIRASDDVSEDVALSEVFRLLQPGEAGEDIQAGRFLKTADKIFGGLSKAWYQFGGSGVHLGLSDPRLNLAGVALESETRRQTFLNKEANLWLHATDPENGDYTVAKDRVVMQVAESDKMLRAYNDLRLLQQVEGKNIEDLQGDPKLGEILGGLSSDESKKVLETLDRSVKAHKAHTQNQLVHMNKMDQYSVAKKLVRDFGMHGEEALKLVDALDRLDGEQRVAALVDAGVDPDSATNLVVYRDRLLMATNDLAKRLRDSSWWVTERRLGQFLVRYTYKDANGKPTSGARSYLSIEDAKRGQQEIVDAGMKLIDKEPVDTHLRKLDQKQRKASGDIIDLFEDSVKKKLAVIDEMLQDDPMAAEIKQLVESVKQDIQQTSDTFNLVNEKTRKFKHGREELNMLEQQREYFMRSSVGMARAETNAMYQLTRANSELKSKEGLLVMRQMDTALDNLRFNDTKAGKAITKFNHIYYLGTNISAALIEGTTFSMYLTPALIEHGAGLGQALEIQKKLLGPTGANVLKQALDPKKRRNPGAGWEDPDHQWVIKRAEMENKLGMRRYSDFEDGIIENEWALHSASTQGKVNPAGLFTKAYKITNGIYQAAQRFNAEISLLSAFELVKSQEPHATKEHQYEKAMMIANMSNSNFGRAGRSIMAFSGRTDMSRTIAMSATSMMSFVTGYISNFLRRGLHASQGNKQAQKAFAIDASIMLAGVGVFGMPFIGSIAEMFRAATGIDVEEELKEALRDKNSPPGEGTFLGDLVTNGMIYASGFPLDVQSRLSIGGVMGFNKYDGFNAKNLLGPVAGFAESVIRASSMALEGDMVNATTEILPPAIKRMIRTNIESGTIRDSNGASVSVGTGVLGTVGSLLGFGSLEQRKSYERFRGQANATKKVQLAKERALNKALNLYAEGDYTGVKQELANYVTEHNGDVDKLLRTFEEKVHKYKLGYADAVMKTTAAQQRYAGLYGVGNPQYQQQALGVSRELAQNLDLPQLLPSRRAQQRAQVTDFAVSQGYGLDDIQNALQPNRLQRADSGRSDNLGGLLGWDR